MPREPGNGGDSVLVVHSITYPQFQAQMEAGAVLVWRDVRVSMFVCPSVHVSMSVHMLFICPCLSICSSVLVLPPHAFWVNLIKASKGSATQQPLATWGQISQEALNTHAWVSTLPSFFITLIYFQLSFPLLWVCVVF